MRTTDTPQAISQRVAERLTSKTFIAFGQTLRLDPHGVIRDLEGNHVWEFEEQDHSGLTPSELTNEIEKVFWYDQEIFTSNTQNLND